MNRVLMIGVLSMAMSISATAREVSHHHKPGVKRHVSHHLKSIQPAKAVREGWYDANAYSVPGIGFGSDLDGMIARHAASNGVPLELARRVVARESGGNPRAVSRGNYGLMQIRHGTARAMGYSGSAAGLLDPETNMTYAMRYLAGAYRAAGGNQNCAVALYARGFYYEAKRQGWVRTGTMLRPTRRQWRRDMHNRQSSIRPAESCTGSGSPSSLPGMTPRQPTGRRPMRCSQTPEWSFGQSIAGTAIRMIRSGRAAAANIQIAGPAPFA